jgi:SAM-dependent methyltransferase
MSVNWIDVTSLSFNSLLLLEREQLSWFPGWLPEKELAIALSGNPAVAWYLQHKCPDLKDWVIKILSRDELEYSTVDLRESEIAVMNAINDLLVYVIDPELYDQLPFLGWDDAELTELVDLQGKVVIDVGAGTGRLSFIAAQEGAGAVFAVEPVGNLRRYIKEKAREESRRNIFPLDGLITDIPLPDSFADVCLGGHVFGDDPEEEYLEMTRVTKAGGMVALIPGNSDRDEGWHDFLVEKGFQWSRFMEPGDGWKRKYWKIHQNAS